MSNRFGAWRGSGSTRAKLAQAPRAWQACSGRHNETARRDRAHWSGLLNAADLLVQASAFNSQSSAKLSFTIAAGARDSKKADRTMTLEPSRRTFLQISTRIAALSWARLKSLAGLGSA